jgi:integrase
LKKLAKRNAGLKKATPLASRVLEDYEYWLNRHYGKAGTYLTNAKTFLKTYKKTGTVISQLESYSEEKSFTLQSFLRRFKRFLEERSVTFLINDLNEKKIPIGNIYVKVFLASRQDLLRGEYSQNTYATILNQFFNRIDSDITLFNKRNAEKFALAPSLSDYTKRLYKSVLKVFCDWAILYQNIHDAELSTMQKKVKKGLRLISTQSLREISSMKVKTSGGQLKRYHKESLNEKQRNKLLQLCTLQRERAIVSLMAWNGLRTIEVIRLLASDCLFKERKIAVWGKGKSSRSKDIIRFFSVPIDETKKYLRQNSISKGKAFPGITKREIEKLIKKKFKQLGVAGKPGKYSPHSLRHTAGQIMYDKGIPLEFVQKTLRHSSLKTTLVYAQKAIDRNYFRTMPASL